MKWQVVILMFSVVLLSACQRHTTLASKGCDPDSAIHFAKTFYRDQYMFYADPDPDLLETHYTSDFADTVAKHAKCVKKNGICNMDYDPWVFAQDGDIDGDIIYATRVLSADVTAVDMHYQLRVHPQYPAESQSVTLVLQKAMGASCWRIDDMVLPSQESIKKIMHEDYLTIYVHSFLAGYEGLSARLLGRDFNASTVGVYRDGKPLLSYAIDCRIESPEKEDDSDTETQRNRIDIVVPSSHPKGLMLSTCRVGVHSQQLAVFDLSENTNKAAWRVTGSYYATWEISTDNQLMITYDQPCKECEAGFESVKLVWPTLPTDH